MLGVRRCVGRRLCHKRACHYPAAFWSRHGEESGELGFEFVEGQASARVVALDQWEKMVQVRERLVATLGVFFGVVGHADHFGDRDGVEAAEGL